MGLASAKNCLFFLRNRWSTEFRFVYPLSLRYMPTPAHVRCSASKDIAGYIRHIALHSSFCYDFVQQLAGYSALQIHTAE